MASFFDMAAVYWTDFSGKSNLLPLFLCLEIIFFHLIRCPIFEFLMRPFIIEELYVFSNGGI